MVIIKTEPADLQLLISLDNSEAIYDETRNRDEISFKVEKGKYNLTLEHREYNKLSIPLVM
jgi:hypothetical protein